nr:response regulator transcription factor [uncultured Sphingomonas sp.]
MDRGASIASGRTLPVALIISDVMLFREGLRAGLVRLGALDVVAATSPEGARAILARQQVEVVILDASRSTAPGHAAELKSSWPYLKLIAFGICSRKEMVAGAEAGICAFVDQDGDVEDINRAALMALRDESYCSPRAAALLINHIMALSRAAAPTIVARLTEREHEVASMVGRGLSNKQIAQELCISPATVKNHVHNILEKSKLPGRSAIGIGLERSLSR